MANTFKSVTSGSIGTGLTDVYTCPGSTTTIVLGASMSNTTTNPIGGSIKLAKNAVKNKADYIALGAFNYSKTKKVKYKASIKLLKKVRRITKLPIVAIGGINSNNYKKLLLNKANLLAISGYIWKNKKLKPIAAIKKLR